MRSSSRVRKTRRPRRLSISVRSRRATASVMSFSSVPRPPCAPGLVAAMAGIDHDGAHAGRRRAASGQSAGRRRRRRDGGAGAAAVRRLRRRRQQLDHRRASARVGLRRRRRDACANFGPGTRRTRGRRLAGLQRLQEILRRRRAAALRSSASASKVTTRRPGSTVTRAGVGRRDVEGHRGAAGDRLRRARRHAARADRRRSSSRAGRRSSMRVSSAGPSARGRKSSGSSQRLP